ncbi:MAG: N-acetyltransferase [Planctomycetes bacterium]|nr:N-acetyltransferase [Planctomycetota bacterium]
MKSPDLKIRPETHTDVSAIRAVNTAAFPTAAEAALVDRLRGRLQPWISLVAEAGGVVGHILFTPVQLGAHSAMALGPMAVLPGHQRDGVGLALVRAGLQACADAGHNLVFVLGHPDYYTRFGFKPTHAFGISCEFQAPPEAFMVAELQPGALQGMRGIVRYHAAFNDV